MFFWVKRKIKDFDLKIFFLIFFSLIIFITSGAGADFVFYVQWTDYFTSLDLKIFEDAPKSINGVPLLQWQYGIGLLAAIPNKLLGIYEFLNFVNSGSIHNASIKSSIISSILCLINITLLIFIIKKYTKSNFFIIIIVSSFFLFIPSGYYANKFSTESWSVFLILSALSIIEINKISFYKYRYLSPIFLGIINYFLLLVKVTNIIICLSLFIIYLTTISIDYLNYKKNYKYIIKIIFISAVVPVIAVFLLAIYHYIINGNIFLSPYNLSDDQFSFISFKNFKILEILFSPLHGLLFYHPLFLCSLFYLIYKIFSQKEIYKPINIITITVVFAYIFQIVLQSSYIVWWGGTGTYGARYFSGVSVLVFYVLLNYKKSFYIPKLNILFIFFICFFVAYQSYILGLDESNFKSLNSFILNEQDLYDRMWRYNNSKVLIILIISTILLSYIFKIKFNLSNLNFLYLFIILSCLLSYLFLLFSSYNYRPMLIPFVFLLSYLITANYKKYLSKFLLFTRKFSPFYSLSLFIIIFLISIFFQVTLFNQLIQISNPNYIGGKSFNCSTNLGMYKEYLQIPGYQKEKSNLLGFLERNGCIIKSEGYDIFGNAI